MNLFVYITIFLALLAAYRALCVGLWLVRGSTRTRNLFTRQRSETFRQAEPAKYWSIVAFQALVTLPITVMFALGAAAFAGLV